LEVVSNVEAGGYANIDNFGAPTLGRVMVTVEVKRHTFPGAIVMVEPDMPASPGDFVIVLNLANQATFKQRVLIDGRLFLKPLNGDSRRDHWFGQGIGRRA
jgi:hypothetical protein